MKKLVKLNNAAKLERKSVENWDYQKWCRGNDNTISNCQLLIVNL